MNPWDALISNLPNPHLLQTYEWGQVKSRYGWKLMYAVWDEDGSHIVQDTVPTVSKAAAAALILKKAVINRGFAAKLSILYLPKGPLLRWNDEKLRYQVLRDLGNLTKKHGAIFLKADPDIIIGTGIPGTEEGMDDGMGVTAADALKRRGWVESRDQIQFRNTMMIDLTPPEEELLSRMKQKTRYNIRLAERKGVQVRSGSFDDLPLLYKMYAETSVRDGFVIRDETYYRSVWESFMNTVSPHCEPLIAEVEGEPVAGILLFTFAGRAYYLNGMSREIHREKMPTYLLQWEAMKRAKSTGCSIYDLWGAPDVFNESDSMWGVYRFKEGLGGKVIRTAGAWDYVPNKLWYKIYSEVMPRILDIMRWRGTNQTRQGLE